MLSALSVNSSCVQHTTTEMVENTAPPRITEARLKRETLEGKLVDFWRTERGYEIIRLEALNGKENKVLLIYIFGAV